MPRLIPDSALDAFIDAVAHGATVQEASAAAHIGRTTAYDYRQQDPEFARRWEEALEAGLDRLEDELYVRALDRDDPGSADLLMFLLARHRPQVYRRAMEVDVGLETTADPPRTFAGSSRPPDPFEGAKRACGQISRRGSGHRRTPRRPPRDGADRPYGPINKLPWRRCGRS